MDNNSRLVYSTDKSRIVFHEVKTEPTTVDDIVRIQSQTSGCRGCQQQPKTDPQQQSKSDPLHFGFVH